jgi:phage terminase small subunit
VTQVFFFSLKAQKQKLETIKSTQVGNLEDLEDQLEESQEILKNMKQNVVGEILQNMMDVVLSSDVDQNDKLDDGEIDGFIKRMEDMNNVDFNNQEVKAAINAKGGSVDAIMDLAKNLLLENDNSNRTRFFNIKKSN